MLPSVEMRERGVGGMPVEMELEVGCCAFEVVVSWTEGASVVALRDAFDSHKISGKC